jgi:hypothetical protein
MYSCSAPDAQCSRRLEGIGERLRRGYWCKGAANSRNLWVSSSQDQLLRPVRFRDAMSARDSMAYAISSHRRTRLHAVGGRELPWFC